jgi:predicted ArsR family transcriptional regulator
VTAMSEPKLPAWLIVLGHLYRFRDHEKNPVWAQTAYGMADVLDMPYATVCKWLVRLVKEGYAVRDKRFIVGKQRTSSGRTRQGIPFSITEKGKERFEVPYNR